MFKNLNTKKRIRLLKRTPWLALAGLWSAHVDKKDVSIYLKKSRESIYQLRIGSASLRPVFKQPIMGNINV